MASTSSYSATLVGKASDEGLKHLYRTLLCQARLLATTLDDPVILSSHRYLARQTLDPLMVVSNPTAARKRLHRVQSHRRHLADANFGWEHAVHRALSLAYGRTGKLRRDALSDLSPQRSNAKQEERYPKQLRRKEVGPVLSALLTSAGSMDGAVVKSQEHLTGRPPPPYLPALDDPLVKLYGKAQGRRRVLNAAERFRKDYMRKVRVPVDVVMGDKGGKLFGLLEDKARPIREGLVNSPKRLSRSQLESETATATQSNSDNMKGSYPQAKHNVERYRSDMHSSEHRKKSLRTHGWTSHPKDFSKSRARRRLYARILDESPLLVLDPSSHQITSPHMTATGLDNVNVKKDPLGIRAKLRHANQLALSTELPINKIKIARSTYAVGYGKGEVLLSSPAAKLEPAEEAREEWLHSSEKDYLRQQAWI